MNQSRPAAAAGFLCPTNLLQSTTSCRPSSGSTCELGERYFCLISDSGFDVWSVGWRVDWSGLGCGMSAKGSLRRNHCWGAEAHNSILYPVTDRGGRGQQFLSGH